MKNIAGSVAVNDFVRRQTKDSGKTYAIGLTHKEIASHAQDQLTNGNYRSYTYFIQAKSRFRKTNLYIKKLKIVLDLFFVMPDCPIVRAS